MDNGTKVVTANYVIDPWFFKKNASADLPTATAQLSYSNPYRVGEQGTMNNIGAIWDSYSKKLACLAKLTITEPYAWRT